MHRSRSLRRLLSLSPLEERTMLASHGWQEHVLEPAPESYVAVLDVDVDGDLDFVTIGPSTTQGTSGFFWQENLGTSQLGQRHLITEIEEGDPFDAIATDLNYDGRTDLLLVSYGFEIDHYRMAINTDHGFQVADNSFGSYPTVQKRSFADVNLDGFADMLVTADYFDKRLQLFLLDAQGRGRQVLKSYAMDGFNDAAFFDVDGDGDLDVVTSMSEQILVEPQLVWYQHLDGHGRFEGSVQNGSVSRTLVPAPVSFISVADIDGEGETELLVNRRGLGLFVYEHVAGQGLQSRQLNVDPPDVVDAFDIDSDGDIDLLGFETWHENRGGEYVAQPLGLPSTLFRMQNLDMDGDGTLDFYDESSRTWYEFRVAGDANADGKFCSSDLVAVMAAGTYLGGSASFSEGDWNGDGVFDTADLVFAFASGLYDVEC